MPSPTGHERLPLVDADVTLFAAPELGAAPSVLFESLIGTLAWQQEDIVLFGRRMRQPRLLAWYGDAGAVYRYSGVDHAPRPWTPMLDDLRRRVEILTGARFNSVLANLYRDHRDSMGLHADDEPELGERPVIASLSLGTERAFRFRHRRRKDIRPVRVVLPAGSLLVMAGDTQRNWKHEVPKQARPCGPRINLTFRFVRAR